MTTSSHGTNQAASAPNHMMPPSSHMTMAPSHMTTAAGSHMTTAMADFRFQPMNNPMTQSSLPTATQLAAQIKNTTNNNQTLLTNGGDSSQATILLHTPVQLDGFTSSRRFAHESHNSRSPVQVTETGRRSMSPVDIINQGHRSRSPVQIVGLGQRSRSQDSATNTSTGW